MNKMNMHDSILKGISAEELIHTVQANEEVINKGAVMKVYREILKFRLEAAEHELEQNMSEILKQAK